MANTKEIQNRIKSIKDTQKITNAMYMISSSKLKKARTDLENTEPYFYTLQVALARMFLRWSICTSTAERESRKRTEGEVIWSLPPTKVWLVPTTTM